MESCLSSVRGVAGAEVRPVPCDRIDVRRRHTAASDSPTAEGEIVPAQVVGEDEDDVRRALAPLATGRVGSAAPVNGMGGAHRDPEDPDPRQGDSG